MIALIFCFNAMVSADTAIYKLTPIHTIIYKRSPTMDQTSTDTRMSTTDHDQPIPPLQQDQPMPGEWSSTSIIPQSPSQPTTKVNPVKKQKFVRKKKSRTRKTVPLTSRPSPKPKGRLVTLRSSFIRTDQPATPEQARVSIDLVPGEPTASGQKDVGKEPIPDTDSTQHNEDKEQTSNQKQITPSSGPGDAPSTATPVTKNAADRARPSRTLVLASSIVPVTLVLVVMGSLLAWRKHRHTSLVSMPHINHPSPRDAMAAASIPIACA